ncbi:amidase [Jatrophihabitans endophyticus]|uniref:amidase n=1 Tax=Jatrophihabitans endophyticus TaxID=1206085 RepID=UPI0019EFD358|nr:amidase family protein [Jatrophihabitans endophyticus]MBE7188816.1 amidase [Jatrophihabitans endophyticus]
MGVWTAVEVAEEVRDGRRTARAVVEDALNRIEGARRFGAYQRVRTFAALREADAVDARPDRSGLRLAGVPIAIKDNVAVTGEPMRVGTTASDPAPQTADHQVVARLRAAGAVVVGLTRVPELCVFGTTDGAFGTARNPWDPDRTPGGSSGGSAAAVASGTVPIALGNDGMGSIRIPAACCGLVGIKPGSGVVPAELGNGSWFGMAENGPLTTTVADAALMLSVLAGREDLASPVPADRLRIAVSVAPPATGVAVDPHRASATQDVAPLLREAGHEVREADPPYDQLLALSELARWTAGTELDARLMTDRSALAVRTSRHAALGRAVLRAGFPHESGRRRWRQRAEAFFEGLDVLVTPALARSPVPAKQWHERGWLANLVSNLRYAPFAAPWNLAGWPAMVVPVGLGPDGLPLGVQLVAPPGGEARLLGLAAQLEQLRPWMRTAPAHR